MMGFDEFQRELLDQRDRVENLVVFRRVDSTNLAGRRILGEYLRDHGIVAPVLLVAWEQQSGRGRQGRRWESPPGLGVYATLLWQVGPPELLQTVPLLVGVGLCRFLESHLQRPPKLKWPNDVLVEGRKIGGVLIETVAEADGPVAAIVGFGINHGQREGELPTDQSTSMRLETQALPSLARTTVELAAAICRELESAAEVDYAIRAYCERSLHRPGDHLRCRLGESTFEGEFLGFSPLGHLRLATAEGERVVTAGEIIAGESAVSDRVKG